MYNYGSSSYDPVGSILGGVAIISMIISLASIAGSILMIISQWKIYKKAGKKGWEAIVPVYNLIVLLEIVELPIWYIALFFVPFANIYATFKIFIELAHKFGKSTGFGVATVFFSIICLPILAFGKNNVYKGTTADNTQNQIPQSDFNNNIFQNEQNNVQTNIQQQQLNLNTNSEITQIEPIQNADFNIKGLTPNNPEMAETVESIPTMNPIVEPTQIQPSVNNITSEQQINIVPNIENTQINNIVNNEVNQTPFVQPEPTNMFQNTIPSEPINVAPTPIEQNTIAQPVQGIEPQNNVIPNVENTQINNTVNNELNQTPFVQPEPTNMFQNTIPSEPINVNQNININNNQNM